MNYYTLLVFSILLTAVFLKGNQHGCKRYVIVASLLLFAVYGLRDTYRIGVDSTTSYIGQFNRIQEMPWTEVIEGAGGVNLGFALLIKAFSSFLSSDYQLYITLISLFVTVCFGRLLYRYSPSPVQSILYHFGLLLFIFHFSALKQSIAMAVLMLAFDALMERRPIRFFLLVFLAGQFHFPAMVFLPAYLFTRLRPGKGYIVLLGIALVLTYVFRSQLINLMDSLYKDSGEKVDLSGVRFLRTKALIMLVIIVSAVCFRIPTKDDFLYGTLLGFMGFALIFQTFCGYNNIFERLADYYFQFAVIFIPMVFDRNVERRALFSWRFMEIIDTLAPYLFCGFGVYRFLTFVTGNSFYYPFRFFFQS